MMFKIVRFLFLILFIMPGIAQAFYQDGVVLNSIAMDFDFSEFSEEGEVVNERGILYGGELELGMGFGSLWVSGAAQFLKGSVVYDGETQAGVPHKTSADEIIYDYSLQIGRIYESWRRHDYATIYAGIGFHQWVRDIKSKINPTTDTNIVGLFERYTWLYANVGARGFLFRTTRSHMMIEINLLRTIKPTMDVSFRGIYDEARISLGEHYGARVSLPFRYEITRTFQLYSELFFEAWDLGKSKQIDLTADGFAAGGLSEPRSASRFTGLVLGVFLKFD